MNSFPGIATPLTLLTSFSQPRGWRVPKTRPRSLNLRTWWNAVAEVEGTGAEQTTHHASGSETVQAGKQHTLILAKSKSELKNARYI